MTTQELRSSIQDQIPLTSLNGIESSFSGCYTGDLLSDVLAHALPGQILVTVQAHRNTIAVAKEKQLAAIIFCNGRQPSAETLSMAESCTMALFTTPCTQYETSAAIARAMPRG